MSETVFPSLGVYSLASAVAFYLDPIPRFEETAWRQPAHLNAKPTTKKAAPAADPHEALASETSDHAAAPRSSAPRRAGPHRRYCPRSRRRRRDARAGPASDGNPAPALCRRGPPLGHHQPLLGQNQAAGADIGRSDLHLRRTHPRRRCGRGAGPDYRPRQRSLHRSRRPAAARSAVLPHRRRPRLRPALLAAGPDIGARR